MNFKTTTMFPKAGDERITTRFLWTPKTVYSSFEKNGRTGCLTHTKWLTFGKYKEIYSDAFSEWIIREWVE